jgi:hypothetical protein
VLNFLPAPPAICASGRDGDPDLTAAGDFAHIAEVSGWTKAAAAGFRKTRHRGLSCVGWMFTLTTTAYNLVRLPKLLGVMA